MKQFFLKGLFLFAISALFFGCAHVRNEGHPPPPPKPILGGDDNYRTRKLDILSIRCVEDNNASQQVVISAEGEVDLYLLNRVNVENMTTFEIKNLLAKLYREASIYKDPHFFVTVIGYAPRIVRVTGFVSAGQGATTYSPDRGITFVDAILAHQGISPRGNPRDVRLQRKVKEIVNGKEVEVVKNYVISYKRIQNGEDDDFKLAEDDWIHVSEDWI